MKTERRTTFAIVLENDNELELFKHIWIKAVDIELLRLEPHQKDIWKKYKEFHEKITKELI